MRQILITLINIGVILTSLPCYAQSSTRLFPTEHIYPHYLADPTRVTFNAQYMFIDNSSVNESSERRTDIKIGAALLLYEAHYSNQPWQLVLIGGFHGQFDPNHSSDNIGWDGIYGLHLATRINKAWAYRIGTKHISSHVGDEYAERTGRLRINYTREELRAGLAWTPDNPLTIYGDIARAFDMRNKELQKPWRVQFGTQYDSPTTFWNDQIFWYSALDLSSYEENDWHRNLTIQLGFAAKSGMHTWRLGLELYDGRTQLGEFFQDEDRYASIGLWFDL